MNAKQYLYAIRDEQKEIEELKERIYEMEMSLYPTGIAYDKDRVQTSPQEKMSGTVAAMADYMSELDTKSANLIRRREKAQHLINGLTSSCERQILDIYFLSVRKVKLQDVAAIIGYSRTSTYRYYNSALEHLESLVPNGIE